MHIRKTRDEYRLFVNFSSSEDYIAFNSWKELKAAANWFKAYHPRYALKTRKVRIYKDPRQYRQEVKKAERKRKGAAIQPRSIGIMIARKPRSE